MAPIFRLTKNSLRNNFKTGGNNYLILEEGPSFEAGKSFLFENAGTAPFSFLFDFTGIGNHHRLDIFPNTGMLALFQIRDGVPIFLHHLLTPLGENRRIEVDRCPDFIRVKLDGFHIMHVVTTVSTCNRWGFAHPQANGFTVPEVSVSEITAHPLEWLCLGDGFSNARWPNRHFLSWPELVFGRCAHWLNGCVAAGNSRRIIDIAQKLTSSLKDSKVILAVGSDDLIENESLDSFKKRLQLLIQTLNQNHVRSIRLCTLPPRLSTLEGTRSWSHALLDFGTKHALEVLNFHDWIEPQLNALMIRGEYPGEAAQRLLAENVARKLGLSIAGEPPRSLKLHSPNVFFSKLIRKLKTVVEDRSPDLPGRLL